MNESIQVEGILKRYSSILEVIRAKENVRRKVTDSNSENIQEPSVDVVREYNTVLSFQDNVTSVMSTSRKSLIEKKSMRVNDDIESLCKEFDLTLTNFLQTKEKFDFSLSGDQLDEVSLVFKQNNSTKEYSDLGGYSIRIRDLQTLKNGNWLNDNIVNICGELAKEKAALSNIPCHCFNSFFFKKLSTSGYSSVARWTKKVDIFSMQRVIIPINKNNTHWTMAYIDMEKKEVHYCDSMSGSGKFALTKIMDYLKEELKNKKGIILNEKEWKTIDHQESVPQQKNCTDCGVFTSVNCILACLKLPFDYSQKDIPLIRKYLVYSIVHNKLWFMNDITDFSASSTQMSFLGSSNFTKKFDISDNSLTSSPIRRQLSAKEENQQNPSITEVEEPSLQVEEIQEDKTDDEVVKDNDSSIQDKVDSAIAPSTTPISRQNSLPPRNTDLQPSGESRSCDSWRKSLSDYPVVTADIRNNLLSCRDELYDLISDICDENKHLNDMYNEIRRSPLAEEIKQEYEDAIADWSDKFNDLQNLYSSSLEQNRQLQDELEQERRENDDLRNQLRRITQLEQDLKSATIRRDVLEKELRDAQNELDYVQNDKRKAEAQIDSQKKELRSLKIELNTLRAELDEGVSSKSTREPEEQSSVVLYNRKPALPKRDTQNGPTATALYDYEGNSAFNSSPMRKGDVMTVLKYNDNRDWVLVQLDNNQTWEPVSYLSIQNNDNRESYSRPKSKHLSAINARSSDKKRAKVIADFDGIDRSEMSIRRGEIVQISKEDGEWLLGSVGNRKGWIPLSYIEFF